jgi:hypothetical protein
LRAVLKELFFPRNDARQSSVVPDLTWLRNEPL